MPNYSDESAEDRRNKKRVRELVRIKEFKKAAAVQQLLQSDDGRVYLWWLLEITGAIGSNAMRETPELTAFACGQQQIGQLILAHLSEVAPEGFPTLMMEMVNGRRNFNDTRIGDRGDDSTVDDLFAEPAGSEPVRSEAGGNGTGYYD